MTIFSLCIAENCQRQALEHGKECQMSNYKCQMKDGAIYNEPGMRPWYLINDRAQRIRHLTFPWASHEVYAVKLQYKLHAIALGIRVIGRPSGRR
jgi:hypothetical protein